MAGEPENGDQVRKTRQQRLPLTWEPDVGDGTVGRARVQRPEQRVTKVRPAAAPTPSERGEGAVPPEPEATPAMEAGAGRGGEPDGVRDGGQGLPTHSDPVAGASSSRAETARPASGPARATRVVSLDDDGRTVGQLLMEGRGEKGLTVAQVTQKTRIPREFIEAVEADELERLPAAVYTRSHIRRLCREYGVDHDAALAQFDRQSGQSKTEESRDRFVLATVEDDEAAAKVVYQLRSPSEEEAETPADRRPIRMVVRVVLILMVVLFVVAAVLQYVHRYRLRVPGRAPVTPGASVELGDFVVPQTLPLKELPVPQSAAR